MNDIAVIRKVMNDLDAAIQSHTQHMDAAECLIVAQTFVSDPFESLVFAMGDRDRIETLMTMAAVTMARESCRKHEAEMMEKNL